MCQKITGVINGTKQGSNLDSSHAASTTQPLTQTNQEQLPVMKNEDESFALECSSESVNKPSMATITVPEVSSNEATIVVPKASIKDAPITVPRVGSNTSGIARAVVEQLGKRDFSTAATTVAMPKVCTTDNQPGTAVYHINLAGSSHMTLNFR